MFGFRRGLIRNVCAFASAIAAIAPATADTLLPQTTSYDFERKEDIKAITCNLGLTITNWPAPEVLRFRFIATLARRTRAEYVGFSIDVGDIRIKDGEVSRPQRTSLRSASFDAQSFSSTGRLTGVPTDEGVLMGTLDRATATAFSVAFFQEPFRLTFSRTDSGTSRTYLVSQKASPPIRFQFVACLQNALRQYGASLSK